MDMYAQVKPLNNVYVSGKWLPVPQRVWIDAVAEEGLGSKSSSGAHDLIVVAVPEGDGLQGNEHLTLCETICTEAGRERKIHLCQDGISFPIRISVWGSLRRCGEAHMKASPQMIRKAHIADIQDWYTQASRVCIYA